MGQSQEKCGDLLHHLKARKECCYTGHSQEQCGDLFHSLKAWKGLHGPFPGEMWRFVSQPQSMKGATWAIPRRNVEICFTASKHERGYMGHSQEKCGDLFHSLKAWKELHGPVPGAVWRFASQPQSMKGVLLHGPVPGAVWRFASQPQSMKGVLLHGPVPGAIEQVTVQSAVEPLVRVHPSFRKTPFFSESFAHGPMTMNCTSFKMQVFWKPFLHISMHMNPWPCMDYPPFKDFS